MNTFLTINYFVTGNLNKTVRRKCYTLQISCETSSFTRNKLFHKNYTFGEIRTRCLQNSHEVSTTAEFYMKLFEPRYMKKVLSKSNSRVGIKKMCALRLRRSNKVHSCISFGCWPRWNNRKG